MLGSNDESIRPGALSRTADNGSSTRELETYHSGGGLQWNFKRCITYWVSRRAHISISTLAIIFITIFGLLDYYINGICLVTVKAID